MTAHKPSHAIFVGPWIGFKNFVHAYEGIGNLADCGSHIAKQQFFYDTRISIVAQNIRPVVAYLAKVNSSLRQNSFTVHVKSFDKLLWYSL